MAIKRAFTKGDRVTHFESWDGKGTVSYRRAIVHSCGIKRMVLMDAKTDACIGRNFQPINGRINRYADERPEGLLFGAFGRWVFPSINDAATVVLALELGVEVVKSETIRINQRIADTTDMTVLGNAAFVKHMRQDLTKLHEPRALNRTGSGDYL